MSGAERAGSAEQESSSGAPRAPEVEQRSLSLVFKGNARDYFRLWIVNLCLTLFTLGIFSAWAKVRRKRYFYSHTELEGIPFEYLADPIPILKGRLIGVVLLALWYAGTHFSGPLLLGVVVVGAVLAPWVMVRSAAFNARYSAYRNLTFHFAGTYRGAAYRLLEAALISFVTCGFGYPWALANVRRYFVARTSFGGVWATYTARGGHLARPFYTMVGGAMLGGAVVGAMQFGSARLGRSVTPTLLALYVLYGVGYAYFQARLGRLNWGHSSLGPIDFAADFRARDFIWLYFSNAVAIACSFGLLVPWASIRMYRYRIARLSVEQVGSLSDFVGESRSAVRATGAEVADLFDFDLSL